MQLGDWSIVGIAIVAMAAAILATEGFLRKIVTVSAFLLAEIAFGSDMIRYAKHAVRDDGAWLGVFLVVVLVAICLKKTFPKTFSFKAFALGSK